MALTPSRKYACRKDRPDPRDRTFTVPNSPLVLPAHVDLRDLCPPVYDQGSLGSCTANAIAGAIEFDQQKQNIRRFTPSRLFLYYNERAMEGSAGSDSGATLRDGMRSVNKVGICAETMWPYDEGAVLRVPPASCYQAARAHHSLFYAHVPQTLGYMKSCLAAGFPFVFGISVYESFESDAVARSGSVPLPASGEGLLGGHALLAVGYDDGSARFLVRNSWGAGWGKQGYCTMPYGYLESPDLASDLWTLRVMSS